MAYNIYFPLVDNNSNPLTGSYVELIPYASPYLTGSALNPTGSSGTPTSTYADNTGTAWFYNTVPGIYKVSYTGAGFNVVPIPPKYLKTVIYIQVPYLISGSSSNGFTLSLNSLAQTQLSSSWAFNSISASYSLNTSVTNGIPYSSSAQSLVPVQQTGSIYFQTGSQNLLFVYNGTRWCSSSMA